MSRRSFLMAVSLSLLGTRRMERHNRQCFQMGERRTRNGLTDRERAYLERKGCKEENGEWMSDLVWPA